MKNKVILDLIAEAGMLKRVKRSGWSMLGAPYEESVADHSFRCALIGYILAKMENIDPYPVLVMSLFGDLPESRIGDIHKVANSYLEGRKAEKESYKDQIKGLDPDIRKELSSLRADYDKQSKKTAIIARDADLLECLMQAKEYYDLGFKKAEKFFRKAPGHLRSQAAKKIWCASKKWDSSEWWEKLTTFDR